MKDLLKSREYSGCYKCIANSVHSCEYCKNSKIKFKLYSSGKFKHQDMLNQVKRGIIKIYDILINFNIFSSE
jgi:hypothetical protein